jgi:hypothetical protein
MGVSDRLLAACDRVVWQAPAAVKKFLSGDALIRYDHKSGQWH